MFPYDIIFYRNHGQVKNLPCFFSKKKLYQNENAPLYTAFPAIVITVTLLTSSCSTKNNL